jgi:fatty-acyl-CoA synthase
VSSPPLSFDAPLTLGAQVEARAEHPTAASKVFLCHGDRTWTYREYRDEAVRMAHFLLGRLGRIDENRAGHVATVTDNQLEVLSLLGGCGYAGLTLFGVNTGLRGDTLAGVLNHSRARVLVVGEDFFPEIERVQKKLKHVAPENILVLRAQDEAPSEGDLNSCLSREVAQIGESLDPPDIHADPSSNLVVIFTSGTTALPKGINNNHAKLFLIGAGVAATLGLGADDRGYACMPLHHSNSLFLGVSPALWVGGSVGIRERFSASQFVPDILRYGVTYWNYVGEPVHYILAAIEKSFGGDVERIRAEVTENPRNKLRYALGNGASPPDIDRFMEWLGLEDMFELYSSTEAAFSTFRKKGDPRGSVGEITDAAVKILTEDLQECPPAELDPDGKITNYRAAVGEICRVAPEAGMFQGYFDSPEENAAKYREGVYHSGDLGHVLVRDGKRYLYFDGRTEDWIRKDAENFSASQVARLLSEHPDVGLAAAYGVPCAVSDELVMAALKLRDGARFDPKSFFDFCEQQVNHGEMDPKWFPDFVRIVDEFEYTGTQKILVRPLKAVHFDRRRLPEEPIFWRERGEATFKPFSTEDFATLQEAFERAERSDLLDL